MKEPASAYTQGGLIALVIGIVIGIAVGWWLCSERNTREEQPAEQPTYKVVLPEPAKPDTVVKHIVRRLPVATPREHAEADGTLVAGQTTVYPADTITAAIAESGDSAEVIIPITQRVYEDSTRYRAVIEGYEPRLISLEIYPQRTKPPAAKRFHLGPAIGIGWDGHTVAPFAGLTLTYSLISF